MITHQLLLDIKYFDEVKNGVKNFEIRKDYQGYQVGDILELKAFKSYRNGNKSHYIRHDGDSILKTYNPNRADTITAKVMAIMTADDYNSYSDSKKSSQIAQTHEAERGGHWFNFSKIDKVLKAYFGTDKLPEGYVVMGIKVIE